MKNIKEYLDIDNFIDGCKNMCNELYCIVIKSGFDHLEDEFIMESSLNIDDSDFIAACDVGEESIYFTYIDYFKISKMLSFFRKHKILINYQVIDNVIDFITSDKKYSDLYSDNRNKTILDKYIINNVTIDNVLDRMIDKCQLLPIELDILNELPQH